VWSGNPAIIKNNNYSYRNGAGGCFKFKAWEQQVKDSKRKRGDGKKV